MNYISIPKGLLPRVRLDSYSDAGDTAKAAFHRAGKAFLRKLAEELGLASGSYDVRNNVAGIAVSGEVTLHSDDLYVQLHESCVGAGGVSVLYRSCKSRKDYCGNRNHSASMADLADASRQARFINELKVLIEAERNRKESAAIPA